MSATVFMAAAEAIKAAICRAPAILPEGLVRIGSRRPVAAPQAAELVIHLVQANGQEVFVGDSRMDWDLGVALDLLVRNTPGADAYPVADATLAAIFARLQGESLPGGNAQLISTPSISWDVEEADTTLVRTTLSLRVRCRSAASGLTAET